MGATLVVRQLTEHANADRQTDSGESRNFGANQRAEAARHSERGSACDNSRLGSARRFQCCWRRAQGMAASKEAPAASAAVRRSRQTLADLERLRERIPIDLLAASASLSALLETGAAGSGFDRRRVDCRRRCSACARRSSSRTNDSLHRFGRRRRRRRRRMERASQRPDEIPLRRTGGGRPACSWRPRLATHGKRATHGMSHPNQNNDIPTTGLVAHC